MDKIPVQYKMKVIMERCQVAMGVTVDVLARDIKSSVD